MKIKFRAFDGNNNKMFYPCSPKNDTSIIFNEWGWEIFDHFSGKPERLLISWVGKDINKKNKKCFLMQFVGLFDNNRKEIAEGDILHTGSHYRFIEWHKEFATFNSVYYHNKIKYYGFDASEWHKWTIKGNIYENPELLEI